METMLLGMVLINFFLYLKSFSPPNAEHQKAIKMNRTLVVPPFFKHHFDLTLQIHGAHGTDRDVLPPEVRVDPAAISESFQIKRLLVSIPPYCF